jgi:hypothetical protein
MKRLIPFFLILISGCTVVSNDRVFPKLAWYWSADAKEQRKERHEASVQGQNYRDCLAELSQQLTLRRSQVVDLAAVGKKLADKYGVPTVMNAVLGEWQSGTTNIYTQALACDVMWIQNQAPREQDLSWLLCFHSEWDGSK